MSGRRVPDHARLVGRWLKGEPAASVSLEDIYCAELVALTYQRMGLLDDRRPLNWYDPGRFWSGDRLQLAGGACSVRRSPSTSPIRRRNPPRVISRER